MECYCIINYSTRTIINFNVTVRKSSGHTSPCLIHYKPPQFCVCPQMSVKLETCIFKMANGKNGLLIKPDIHKEGIFYHGNGLENGECGVAFNPVKEEYNGNMTCNLYPSSDPTERQGTIQFIVARQYSTILIYTFEACGKLLWTF